jgi:hypothetical protein
MNIQLLKSKKALARAKEIEEQGRQIKKLSHDVRVLTAVLENKGVKTDL